MIRASTRHGRLDAAMTADPVLAAQIESELRYGQTRWAEVWLACIMTAYGILLLSAGETFSAPRYAVIRSFVGEETAGTIAVACGCARLAALWYNGARQRSPLVRLLGCSAGFLFYAALTAGFLLAGPPLSTGLIYGVLAVAELHSSSRSARDVSVLDSLGIRARRDERDRLAA
ncbi:hypothetical protein [Enterovirga rhinocerotis]|uniref:Uncharacterized protein n=1 Tax=Enterovirga rhinocerotis TaxID=1339210 RepID=A0A4R7BTA2_9HYPH|nr:hypothetical protein [Enterovirga rhinocerotis]TDR88968.1 hypothetical protein EV668_3453 [Enterovirga rhinocerotis]